MLKASRVGSGGYLMVLGEPRRSRDGLGARRPVDESVDLCPLVRDERGQTSILVLLLIPALIIMIGLVVDGGQKTRADQAAQTAAIAAARAATDAASTDQLGGRAGTSSAVRAARSYLGQAGVTGSVQVAAGGRVTITTSETAQTQFLSIIGIGSVTGRGYAESTLVPTGGTP